MKRMVAMVLLVMTTLALSAQEPVMKNGRFEVEIEKSFTVNPATKLIVSNKNGSVNIKEWDKDEVLVTAVKSSKKKEKLELVDVTMENASFLEIEVKFKDKSVSDVTVDISINIPKGMKIGDISTSNGKISLSGGSGDADISSSNGSITVNGFDGKLEANTSNGGIDLRNVKRITEASTSNGSVTVELLNLESDIDLSSSNGTIYIYLADGLSAGVELETSNGKIYYEGINVDIKESSKNYLRGTIGGGGHKIYAETSNGSIYLKKN